jgi:hypothetical protein
LRYNNAERETETETLPAADNPTGSLHDELTCKTPRQVPVREPPAASTLPDGHQIADSRPCYRCISYMHAVGIKRVFWTGEDGAWQGAKVQEFIDMFEATGCGESGEDEGGSLAGMFITKHEVLKLKMLFDSEG